MDSLSKYFEKGRFEAGIKKMIQSVQSEGQGKRLNSLMHIELIQCNDNERSVTFGFPVAEWQLNSNDVMHGGISASVMDLSLGLPANYIAMEKGGLFAPTINMNVSYLLPVPLSDRLVVTAKVVSSGSSLITVTGEAKLKSSGAVAITATAMYKILMPR
ncbi:PaaI family thioesterase [Clostridium aminobutyricum]|uniref:PaaI family thioesterase n=1 Tax=Clostridium aminobutyricum TaxID=33953 RepID=A0A939IK30_CLOAM|nr:PaaI family thioesterase [Clostridium aminobutyricum]MBN7774179.1 PaaI family thioesterase [Clostridium aminobutyricum]